MPLNLSHVSAIIFDMDGVIVDSEPRHIQAFEEVFETLGYAENHGIRFSDYVGKSDKAVWDDFIAVHKPDHSLQYLTDLKQNRTIEILNSEKPIFAGIPELVEASSSRYKLAVASGSLHAVIDTVLELSDLRRFFPTVVSVEDVGKTKPAPDIFLRTADLLETPCSECLVIEDSKAGIEAALAANMQVIAIPNSFPESELNRATHVVTSYQEIENLLATA